MFFSKKKASFGFSLQKSAASLLFSFALILPERSICCFLACITRFFISKLLSFVGVEWLKVPSGNCSGLIKL
ncbi:hypothetical protein ARSQ2_02406 [Arsenophonus endosymbiont of Bemisia tabaci Q2]|nr:hypothetical protein ARSQ2_02406 [Arsenophonus endosymbiont of Bemisia tabaci Q2]